MRKKQICCTLSLIMCLILSCTMATNVPAGEDTNSPTTDPQVLIDQAVQDTMAAVTQVALSVQQTVAAMGGNTTQFTQTPSLTPTAGNVQVSVSVETNCRVGPGTMYGILGVLFVGQTAEVVGRSASSDNWIIKLPSDPTITCWVWGQYATVTGDTSNLAVIAPPPMPTLTITSPAPEIIIPVLPGSASLTIVNNGVTTIFYVYFSLSTNSNWGSDQLGSSTIATGQSYTWTIAPDTYDIKLEDSSHNVMKTWFSILINGPITLTIP